MKHFFLNIIFLAVIVFALACLIDFLISTGLKKTEKNHFYMFNKLMNDTINADVLISGNSRTCCSYNPFIIDSILNTNSINIGVSGQPFGISHLRQKIYDRKNKPPKLLVQNIDYGELNLYSNGYERYQYYPYIWDYDVHKILKDNDFSWAEIYLPLWRYRGDYKYMGIGILELLGLKHIGNHAYKGYVNPNTLFNGEMLRDIANSKQKIPCAKKPEAIKLFGELLQKRLYEGTKVVLVYAPMYSELKNYLEYHESVMQIYDSIAKKYNIQILDYTNMSICSDSTCFYNATHLNKKGAELFTTKFVHDIDSLKLIKE
jgi:hypothetical protein